MVLLFCVVFCLVLGASGQNIDGILERADQQLDALTSRVVSLSDNIDNFQNERIDVDFAVRRLSKTLDDKQGKVGACKRGFFPCSSGPDGGVQCVRDYLVCDGSPDCKNAADEATAICDDMPFVEAEIMLSVTARDKCRKTGKGTKQKLGVVNTWSLDPAHVLPWFPSRPRLTWQYKYSQAVGKDTAYLDVAAPGFGYYNYGTGDIFMGFGKGRGKLGYCKVDYISPRKRRFLCDLDNSAAVIDRDEETCYLTVNVLEK